MKKARLLTILAVVMAVAMLFSACGGGYTVNYYAGDKYDVVTGDMEYNRNIFYRNDIKVRGADPFVLDNTSRDGYYYCYVTQSDLSCYRTKDLDNWENYGDALGLFNPDDPGDARLKDMRDAVSLDIWAPETVYDPDANKEDYNLGEGKGVYFIFFSASPTTTRHKATGMSDRGYEGEVRLMPMLGVSNYAGGPYELVDFTDANSCGGEENVHDIDVGAYQQFFNKFMLFNMDDINPALLALDNDILSDEKVLSINSAYSGYLRCIDMHPFVDEDGTKYLYGVSRLLGDDMIWGVKMDNWAKPDYSTLSIVMDIKYFTVGDKSSSNYNDNEANTRTNEGPQVIWHYNAKGEKYYYLTFSFNSYTNSAYTVGTAVLKDAGNGPLNDMSSAEAASRGFRKLRDEENGMMLSSDSGGNEKVSGPGHHTMMKTEDGKLYCIYHRHDVYANGGGARNPGIDECHWITIENDPYNGGEDLDVIYLNGPTWSLVPKLETVGSSSGPFGLIKAKYTDVSLGAKLTASGKIAEGSSAKYLNDDLLSIYKNLCWQFVDEYVLETEITGEASFNFEFDGTKEIVAVMVYNSKLESSIFREIKNIEIVAEVDGKDTVITISNLKFDMEQFTRFDDEGEVEYVQPGSVVFAEFNALKAKSVKFTIDVPEGQEKVGISEIRILGR